jgi:hypothetical protein
MIFQRKKLLKRGQMQEVYKLNGQLVDMSEKTTFEPEIVTSASKKRNAMAK